MGDALLTNARDSQTNEAQASKTFAGKARLYVRAAGSGNTRYAYIYFNLKSIPVGATILDAKLRLWNGVLFSGAVLTTVERLSAKFGANRLTWNNQPGVTGTTATLSQTGAVAGTLWEFDIDSLVQTVVNGAAWYGFRIKINANTAGLWFHSSLSSTDAMRPELEVSWSDAPEPPENLKPAAGRATSVAKPTLSFDFIDFAGDTNLDAVNVQLDDASDFATPVFDSGWVVKDVPELDLDDTAYAGVAADATIYWRARVRDGAGIVSAWSDYTTFVRKTKGTLTITNPPAPANNQVEDVTPPITWTFTGRTQQKYQVIISLAATPNVWLWTSGQITGTALSVTPPEGIIADMAATYRVTVRVWDDISREKIPDDDTYVEATRDFTYKFTGVVSGVTALAVVDGSPFPYATLTWTRAAGTPDYYTIERDGVVIDKVLGTECFISGTSFQYVDRTTPPRRTHTWVVRAITTGQTSSTGASVNGKITPPTTWLMAEDGTDAVALWNPDVKPERRSNTQRFDGVGDVPPVLVTQLGRSRFEGAAGGLLASNLVSGQDALSQLDRYKRLITYPGKRLRLTFLDQSLIVAVYNATWRPTTGEPGDVEYLVEFDFVEAT